MTAAGLVCTSCGAEASRAGAKFCDACGSPLSARDSHAEYKQVTVLFADVVHSMDFAAAVGRGAAARDHDRAGRAFGGGGAALRRHRRQVHRRRDHGGVRCADRAWRTTLFGHAWRRWTSRSETEHARGRDCSGRDGVDAAAAGRAELRPGDRRRDRFGRLGLHRHRRAGRDGAADGIRRAARRRDAERVHRATCRGRDGAWRAARWCTSRAPTRRSLLNSCWRSAHDDRPQASRVAPGRSPLGDERPSKAILDRSIDGHGSVIGVVGPAGIGKSRIVAEATALAARPWCDGVFDVLRIACQRRSVPCGVPVAARAPRGRRADADAARAQRSRLSSPTPSLTTSSCSRICSASATQRCRRPPSIQTPAVAG